MQAMKLHLISSHQIFIKILNQEVIYLLLKNIFYRQILLKTHNLIN